jgi:hypothetical protein
LPQVRLPGGAKRAPTARAGTSGTLVRPGTVTGMLVAVSLTMFTVMLVEVWFLFLAAVALRLRPDPEVCTSARSTVRLDEMRHDLRKA